MSEVIVIGAGISGLSCAWRLKRMGHEVTVLETSDRAGGSIRTERVKGHLVEWGPNTILTTPESSALVEEAGLAGELITADARAPRFVLVGNRLRKVPFGPLSIGGLLRGLIEPFVPRSFIENESVAGFFRRRAGPQIHDRLVAPFVTGIYAADSETLDMAATFPRLVEFEREYGSVVLGMLRAPKRPRGRLTSFREGMETLSRHLAGDLEVHLGVSGLGVEETGEVRWNGGSAQPRAVVLAVPSRVAADLVTPFAPVLGEGLRRIVSAPMIVAASSVEETACREPIRGFGFLVPRSENVHLLGTLFSSSLFAGRAPPGRVLLTSFLGGAHEPEAVAWSDDRIWHVVLSELRKALPISRLPDPIRLVRHRHAIPQYLCGHGPLVASLRADLRGWPWLFLDGNYLEGVSVPACMEQGQRTAQTVSDYLRRTP